MKVAINSLDNIYKLQGNDIIYAFDNERLDYLINTGLHCVHKDYMQGVDINLTDYDIPCRKKTNISDKNWNILPPKKDFKFAIIIPNFNYADWLDKCLTSVANQTYRNFQVLFVDDMSTDNSVEIAKGYLNKMPLKILQLKQKRYNGGARNEAYLNIDDDVDYIWYIDSDDWIKPNALEYINEALQTNVDVLFIGIAYSMKGKEEICQIPDYKTKYETIQGWSGSCGKVIKKELATRQDCLYNEGTLAEDKNQHCRICINMKSFANLPEAIYIWNRDNTKSITVTRSLNLMWKTSTLRHYADTQQLYYEQQGKDFIIDNILKYRVDKMSGEVKKHGDGQY